MTWKIPATPKSAQALKRELTKQCEAKIAELEAANQAEGNTGTWVDARKSYIEDLKGKLNGHS